MRMPEQATEPEETEARLSLEEKVFLTAYAVLALAIYFGSSAFL